MKEENGGERGVQPRKEKCRDLYIRGVQRHKFICSVVRVLPLSEALPGVTGEVVTQ